MSRRECLLTVAGAMLHRWEAGTDGDDVFAEFGDRLKAALGPPRGEAITVEPTPEMAARWLSILDALDGCRRGYGKAWGEGVKPEFEALQTFLQNVQAGDTMEEVFREALQLLVEDRARATRQPIPEGMTDAELVFQALFHVDGKDGPGPDVLRLMAQAEAHRE